MSLAQPRRSRTGKPPSSGLILKKGNLLNARTIVPFLVDRVLLDARAIVEGDVEVVNMSRRNLNFHVKTTVGPNYLVKQGVDFERIESIEREAAFLQNAADPLGDDLVRSQLPTVRLWDADHNVLVFLLASETHSFAEHHLRTGQISSGLASQAGTALGQLHRRGSKDLRLPVNLYLSCDPPPVLSLHRPDVRVFEHLSGSGLEVIKILQQAPVLCAGFDELLREWKSSSIIHCDMKWDNVVLVPKADGKRGFQVQLVDWEMVQFGDPLWDAASFLAQYLDVWIGSIPIAASAPQANAARIPLERLQPATRLFWKAYYPNAKRGVESDAEVIERVVNYAAARLVQFAIEADQQSAVLSATGVLRLQVAHNMMQRPLAAARSLLGLTV